MRRLLAGFVILLWVAGGCVVKKENPAIVGVAYDRLYREGWQAYAAGDYALAQAKFDTLLSEVTAADPKVYLAKAFSLIPQRKFDDVEAQVSIALALGNGDPYHRRSHLPIQGVTLLTASPLMFQVDVGQPFLGYVGGVSFGSVADENGWMVSVFLGPGHAPGTTSATIPLDFEGKTFTFLLVKQESVGVVLQYPGAQGASLNTVYIPDTTDVPTIELDTVVYIPGETLVVETTYIYPSDTFYLTLDLPMVGDSLEGTFLIRDTSVAMDTLEALGYLALASAAYAQGLADPTMMAKSVAFARAAQRLLDEKGWNTFAWDPLGDNTLSSRFSYLRTQILQAKAFLQMQLYSNAARMVNEIYDSLVVPEDTTFTPEVIQQIATLIENQDR